MDPPSFRLRAAWPSGTPGHTRVDMSEALVRPFLWLALFASAALVVVLGSQNRQLRSELREVRQRAEEPYVGMFVPEVPARTTDDREIVLGRGAQVLYFFTTTCPYCEASAPAVQALADRLREGGSSVELVGVANGPVDETRLYAAEHGFGFPVVALTDVRTLSLYRADIVPTLLVVAPEGRVAYARVGVLDPAVHVTAVTEALAASSIDAIANLNEEGSP